MRLLLRADGDATLGTGHVLRGLAVAEAVLAAGGHVTLAAARLDAALAARAERVGCAVHRLPAGGGAEALAALDADAILLDGYHLPRGLQGELVNGGQVVAAFDDLAHLPRYDAHVVINPQLDAAAARYPARAAHTELLLGPAFAPLRREFLGVDPTPDPPPVAGRILVTLGGADPARMTPRVLAALEEIRGKRFARKAKLEVRVLVGPSNPLARELLAAEAAGVTAVPPTDAVADQLRWADLVITAAGTTTFELCKLGAPMLVVAIADNQRGVAAGLAARGVAESLGWYADVDRAALVRTVTALARDPARRRAMARAGQALVDGLGAARVVSALEVAAARWGGRRG